VKSGDPADEETFIGPMIAASEAERLEGWITEAREAGADLLCGGIRDGAVHEATVLKNVARDQKLRREGVRYAIEDMTEIRSLVIRETGDSKSVNSR
jgi:acyl-CoA reductase-like NAD-dependent aldehyde dehydrogenase